MATSQFGPNQIAATTMGMRMAAVNTRWPVPELIRSFLLSFTFRPLKYFFVRHSNIRAKYFLRLGKIAT
jgi:hypothetical protein